MGLRSGSIPTSDISISSQKSATESIDTVRLGNSKVWVADSKDSSPWIEIHFSQSKIFLNKILIY
jgi:hypothetical protein